MPDYANAFKMNM
jgi:hypothetical protein